MKYMLKLDTRFIWDHEAKDENGQRCSKKIHIPAYIDVESIRAIEPLEEEYGFEGTFLRTNTGAETCHWLDESMDSFIEKLRKLIRWSPPVVFIDPKDLWLEDGIPTTF